ncbi:MAG: cytochrome P450 [Rhodovibrionaceae bacterium]|nr:cytochrome P450 [Rhodovibrionaceae bacterium]
MTSVSTRPDADLHFDPFDPAVIHNPYPAMARLQAEAPVAWSEKLKAWIVTGYEPTRALLRDRRLSSDRISPFFDHLPEAERRRLEPLRDHLARWLVFMDPPGHTRLRALMNKAFTPRAVARLRGSVGEIVDDLLDAAEDKGHWDVIDDLGYPLPATVIADLLGVPRRDVGHLKRWSDDLGAFVLTSRLDEGRHDRAAAAVGEMENYFADLVRHRRAARRDDLVSGLVAAEEAGDFLSVEELVAACVLLLFAGHETTTHLIGNGLLALIQNPVQMAALRARLDDEAAVRNAVEEMLRFDGPVLSVTRNVVEDIETGGQHLRADERLFFLLAAAGRDPASFPDPHSFDIARAEAPRHVNFAHGIHFCLGAPLARLEGEVAFPRLLRRFREIALAEPGHEWSDSLVIRGLTRLPVETRPS